MWNWLSENHGTVAAIATVLSVGVWTLYLQLLLSSYRHRLRSKILINHGAGRAVGAECIIANMGAEPIYVEAILLTVVDGDSCIVCSLGDLDVDRDNDDNLGSPWYQGPLESGRHMTLGPYADLLSRAAASQDTAEAPVDGAADASNFTVTVVATDTAEDRLVAAERRFDVETAGGRRLLRPRSFMARQIRSRRARRELEELILGSTALELASRPTRRRMPRTEPGRRLMRGTADSPRS